jgi:hypothetical protein
MYAHPVLAIAGILSTDVIVVTVFWGAKALTIVAPIIDGAGIIVIAEIIIWSEYTMTCITGFIGTGVIVVAHTATPSTTVIPALPACAIRGTAIATPVFTPIITYHLLIFLASVIIPVPTGLHNQIVLAYTLRALICAAPIFRDITSAILCLCVILYHILRDIRGFYILDILNIDNGVIVYLTILTYILSISGIGKVFCFFNVITCSIRLCISNRCVSMGVDINSNVISDNVLI